MKRLMTTLLFVLLYGTGLCLAQDGVTVSGAVTFTDGGNTISSGITGTVSLLDQDQVIASGLVDTKNIAPDGGYNFASVYAIENVPAGTYTLSFIGKGNNYTLVYEKTDIVVGQEAVVHDFEATIDNTRGFVTLRIRFDANIFETGYSYSSSPVVGATVTCTPTGADDGTSVSAVSDAQGEAKFLLAKNATTQYRVSVASDIYLDTTFTMTAFTENPYAPGGFVANDLNVYMREKPLPTVTVSGSVTKPTDMPTGLKLQLTTIKNKALEAIDLKENYSFAGVPVGSGNTTLALYDPTNYSDYYRVYNYAITSPENGQFTVTGEDGGTFTQNITITKVAANVTGTVKNASSMGARPTITLTKQGESSPVYTTNNVQYTGGFTIAGVKPGTYTIGAQINGFTLKNAPTVTVTESLKDVAIADELEFEAADMEITFSVNSLYLRNSTTYEMTYLKGAEVKLYAGGADITTATPLATATADDYGNASLLYNGKIGDQFIITVTHAAIKTAQQTVTVTSSYSSCSFYGLLEPSGSEVPTNPLLGVKDFTYTQLTDSTLTLSWNWPTEWQNEADYEIQNISLSRRASSASSERATTLASWSKSTLEFGKPATTTDTVPQTDEIYIYSFSIRYAQPVGTFDTGYTIDMRIRHTLAYGVNDEEMGSIQTRNEAGQHYVKNDQISLIAKANDGYKFVEWQRAWSIAEGAPIDPAYTTTRDTLTFYMPSSDLRLTAIFKKNRFVITLNATPENAGTVSGGGTYEGDTTVTVKAVANNGYQFVAWMDGDKEVTTKAEYKFKPEDDRTLTAVFEEMKYVLGLGVNHAEWGQVEGGGEVTAGSEVTVKAMANEGYKFVAWMEGENEASKAEIYTFTMPANDLILTAVFENAKTQYTVTLKAEPADGGTVEGGGEFTEGADATVKATPKEGFRFVAWKEGETEVSTSTVYSFVVSKDVTLTAVFAEGTANETLESAIWTVFSENGTLIIKGVAGDRYMVYDLNGVLAGQARCTGADIRMDVAPNRLYIVRRIASNGHFDAKKIVVR